MDGQASESTTWLTRARRARPAFVFLLAFAALNVWGAAEQKAVEAERLASVMFYESVDDLSQVPRRDRSGGEHLERFWQHIPDARSNRLVYIVGMSQLLTIWDRKRGDRFTSENMDDELAPRGVRVFELAAPNIDNEEAVSYLLASLLEPQTKPYALVYGVCFDKFRNVDVRPSLRRFMLSRPGLLSRWEATALRYQAQRPRAAEKMLGTLAGIAEDSKQIREESFETRLRRFVGRFLPIVSAREPLNARLQSGLYFARNELLGIKTSSKRPILGARYELNLDFLELMADIAGQNGVKFLPYVIPLNPVGENPYVASEYRDFKLWFEEFTKRRSLPYVNLENLVPPEEWGILYGQPDFKHFGVKAHKRTASALVAALRGELTEGLAANP